MGASSERFVRQGVGPVRHGWWTPRLTPRGRGGINGPQGVPGSMSLPWLSRNHQEAILPGASEGTLSVFGPEPAAIQQPGLRLRLVADPGAGAGRAAAVRMRSPGDSGRSPPTATDVRDERARDLVARCASCHSRKTVLQSTRGMESGESVMAAMGGTRPWGEGKSLAPSALYRYRSFTHAQANSSWGCQYEAQRLGWGSSRCWATPRERSHSQAPGNISARSARRTGRRSPWQSRAVRPSNVGVQTNESSSPQG
jgi:hypothetical protein